MTWSRRTIAAEIACAGFENILLAERVAERIAGETGWNPPDDPDDYAPYELWDEALRLFPPALQGEFDPEQDEEHGHNESTISLMSEVALSQDSGISLTALCTISEDADEDGSYQHSAEKLDYTLWVDNKDWTGDNVAKLRAHLHQFQNTLKERDPTGYQKFLGK